MFCLNFSSELFRIRWKKLFILNAKPQHVFYCLHVTGMTRMGIQKDCLSCKIVTFWVFGRWRQDFESTETDFLFISLCSFTFIIISHRLFLFFCLEWGSSRTSVGFLSETLLGRFIINICPGEHSLGLKVRLNHYSTHMLSHTPTQLKHWGRNACDWFRKSTKIKLDIGLQKLSWPRVSGIFIEHCQNNKPVLQTTTDQNRV